MEMTFKHEYCGNTYLLRVVYIEYQNGIPHAAIGERNGIQVHFDFENDCKEIEMFMYYNSGYGGEINKIQAPHYCKKYKLASYWIHSDARFKGKPINIKQLNCPIEYNGNPNPFDNARQVFSQEYCKFCEKYYDQDSCPEHHVINDEGELEYIDGSKASQ